MSAADFVLPDKPSIEWLKKSAKERLDELRAADPSAQLADAQFALAKDYGFASWRALKAHIDALTLEGQMFDAARKGDVATVSRLLEQGFDPNYRERGDDTYAMHWAAAAGQLDVVRLLADAGGDVVGAGDDHMLEVIGWATCWQQCDDPASDTCARARVVTDFLVSRGARHHIYSAIALNDADEVRGIVARDPGALNRRMSRNEDHRMPLHFAIRHERRAMVALLVELGADPLAVDGGGMPAAALAFSPDVDGPVMDKVRAMTLAELHSAEGGRRPARLSMMDFAAALALSDFALAERLVRAAPGALAADGVGNGALHLMAKRNDVRGARWLLEHGAAVSSLWAHWDAKVTPLHLAALENQLDVAKVLLDAGADTRIKDDKHDADPLEWAEFFQKAEMARLIATGRR